MIGSYDVVAVAHREIYEAAWAILQDRDQPRLENDRRLEEWVREVCEETVYTFGDFFRRWGQNSGLALRLAYFLGHADESRLELSAADCIDSAELAIRLRPQDSDAARRRILLFLNGCSTVGQAKQYGWISLLRIPGLNGILGTEVPIPDLFGVRFANAFFYYFLGKGMTLQDSLQTLRVTHLPLSLAYSAYAADKLAVMPKIVPELSFENFSLKPTIA